MWLVREAIPEGEKRRNGSVKHDVSVPLSSIQRFLDLADSQVRSYDADLELSVYGHVGDGNLHYNVLIPPGVDRMDFTKRIEGSLSLQLYDTAAALGGTFSAEHGVGRFKKHLLERYGDVGRIAAMRRIKTAFDPADIMNPGAIVRPLESHPASAMAFFSGRIRGPPSSRDIPRCPRGRIPGRCQNACIRQKVRWDPTRDS
ncbi:FAD/FMN-containing dehydrogenase [Bradyrhizobium sp. GM24.11]